jgi:hypothetical protein
MAVVVGNPVGDGMLVEDGVLVDMFVYVNEVYIFIKDMNIFVC